MSDQIRDFASKYRIILTSAGLALTAIWYSVTWANDKLEKIERVTKIEAKVDDIEAKVNQLSIKADRMAMVQGDLVKRQNETASLLESQNQEIINRLDRLIRSGG